MLAPGRSRSRSRLIRVRVRDGRAHWLRLRRPRRRLVRGRDVARVGTPSLIAGVRRRRLRGARVLNKILIVVVPCLVARHVILIAGGSKTGGAKTVSLAPAEPRASVVTSSAGPRRQRGRSEGRRRAGCILGIRSGCRHVARTRGRGLRGDCASRSLQVPWRQTRVQARRPGDGCRSGRTSSCGVQRQCLHAVRLTRLAPAVIRGGLRRTDTGTTAELGHRHMCVVQWRLRRVRAA